MCKSYDRSGGEFEMKKAATKPILRCGQVITGRWEHNSYTTVRLIGSGGTGQVYLVKDRQGLSWAMKISTDVAGITHEHRILRFLNNCSGVKVPTGIPNVRELDDFQIGSQVYHYIITQYCRGINLGKQAGRLNTYHVSVIGRQVAEFLAGLHDRGYVFGDLKPGNIVYNPKTGAVYLVDFGSVTMKGQGLQQYTPGYDRLSWGVGNRIADEAYDIFALGMLLAALVMGKTGGRRDNDLESLIIRISRCVGNGLFRETVTGILRQEIDSCREVSEKMSIIVGEIISMENKEVSPWFVGIIGVTAMAAFILSWAYYYQ